MKYQLTVRKFTGNDVSLKCKYVPNGELEIYARALVEELDNINTISSVSPIGYTDDEYVIEILLKHTIALPELKSLIFKILLSESFVCKLQFKELHTVA